MNRIMRKPVYGVFDKVRHKPGCTTTYDGSTLGILNLDCTIFVARNKGVDQLHGYRTINLRLCFHTCKM